MPKRYLEENTHKFHFIQTAYRRLVALAFFWVVILACCVGYFFYQDSKIPTLKYFATTTDGQVIEITPIPRN